MLQPTRSCDVDQTSFFSNGTNDLRCQQPRSHSRVSSLIKAFNSDGQRDAFGMDGRYQEGIDDTSWERSYLIRMQSGIATSHQQNCAPFPSAGQCSLQDSSCFSGSAHMNAASAFTGSSHSKHSMVTQVNCNSNFFIHSEFSPFKVWRDYNRMAYQQQEFSGFMQPSAFPQWCETKMYRELSLDAQTKSLLDRNKQHQRNNVQAHYPRTPVTSTVLQKASALEKRCESELAGNYPHWKSTKRMGTNKLPSQRPSTASPTTEMSRRVRDTISSVKALQQKIKLMAGQNVATEMSQNFAVNNQDFMPYGYNGLTAAPNVVATNTSTTPFNISKLQVQNTNIQQYVHSPQPVEHAPVRAESRGATPDIRVSSYKSKGASLLFNLKDNRKRVKSTYSPPKFKGFDSVEKNKEPPKDTVIDIPEFFQPENQSNLKEDTSLYHYEIQRHSHMPYSGTDPRLLTGQSGQTLQYPSSAHYSTVMQGEVVHPSGFTGFTPENYTSNQVANHQKPHYDPSLFTPYKQREGEAPVGGHSYTSNPSDEASQVHTEDKHMSPYSIRQQCLNNKAQASQMIDQYHDNNSKLMTDKEYRLTQDTEKLKLASSPGETAASTFQEFKDEACLTKEWDANPKHIKDTEIHKSTAAQVNAKPTIHVRDNTAMLKQETGSRESHSPFMKKHFVQPKRTTEQSHNNIEELCIPATDKQVQDSMQGKPSDVTAEPIKQHTQARLAAGQPRAQAERLRAESAKLILAGQTRSETDEAPLADQGQTHAKAELKMADNVWSEPTEETSRKKPMEGLEEKEEHMETVVRNKGRNVIEEEHRSNSGQDDVTKDKLLTGGDSTQIQPMLLPKEHALQVVDQSIKYKSHGEQNEKVNVKLPSENKTQRFAKEQFEGSKGNVGTTTTARVTVENTEETKLVELRKPHVKTVEERRNAEVQKIGINTSSVQDKKTESFSLEEAINTNESKQENVEVRSSHSKLEQTTADLVKESTSTVSSEKEVNSDQNNIKLVKTELAKTKVEPETLREGHKEKVRKDNAIKNSHSDNKGAAEQAPQQLRRYGRDHVDRGADDYESLREKYGFNNPISTLRNKEPPRGHGSPTNENMPSITEPTKVEKLGEQKSENQTGSSKTEKGNGIMKLPTNEDTDHLYVYSESSKEFRIGDQFSNSPEQTTYNNVAENVKDSTGVGQEISQKQSHVSQQSESECPKLVEGKSKLERVVLHKSQPAKALTQRERALTKQEILTSKIKAHAEKEISAIKEKGLAKNPSKHFPSSHYQTVKPTPASKEALDRHESKLTGDSGDPFKEPNSLVSVSQANSSDTAQKHVPKGSFNINKPDAHKDEQATIQASTDVRLIEGRNREMDSGAMSLMLKNKLEAERKEETKESQDEKKAQDTYVPGGFVKDTSLTIGQKETTDEDDHLQIMGIMVTVRENTSVALGQTNSQEQSSTKKLDKPEPDKCSRSNIDEKGTLRDLKATKDCKSASSENNQNPISTEATANNDSKDAARSPQQVSVANTMKLDSDPAVPGKTEDIQETKTRNIHSNGRENGATTSEEHKLQTETISSEVTAKVATEGIHYKEDGDARESHASVKEDITSTINQPKSRGVKDKTFSQHDERHHRAPDIQSNDSVGNKVPPSTSMKSMEGETNNEDGVHIDSIAIRVVSSVVEKDLTIATSKQLSVTTEGERVSQSESKEDKLRKPHKAQTSHSVHLKDKSEDDMGVERILSSIRKLADSLKQTQQVSHHDRPTEGLDGAQARPVEVQNNVESTMTEQDYFQIEGRNVASAAPLDSDAASMSNDVSKRREVTDNDRIQEGKGFVRKAEPSNQNTKSQNKEEARNNLKDIEMDLGQGTHAWKRHTDSRPTSRERERHSNRMLHQKGDHSVMEDTEIQSKPKRAAAIPEISAIADYARLKVIVSEEPEDTCQDVPPNKKEGFFPLIQSRRSRCPNFTDKEEDFTKEKPGTIKTEVSSKVNKEPKPVVFPITEKAHLRTGMFKLGEKEKTELDNKNKPGVLQKVVKQDPVESAAPRGDMLRAEAEKDKASILSESKPGIVSTSQQFDDIKPEDSSLNRKMEDSNHFTMGGIDNNSSKTREYDSNKNIGRNISESIQVKTKEGTQNSAKAMDEKKDTSEDAKIKNLIEESKAHLREEQDRAAKRELERRAREREAIAAAIKERRQKQREVEKQAEKDLKQRAGKHDQEERRVTEVQDEEQVKAKLKAVDGRSDVEERKTTQTQEEQRREDQHHDKANLNKTLTQRAEKTTVGPPQQNPQEKEHSTTRQTIVQTEKDEKNALVAEEKSNEGEEEQTKGSRNEETITQRNEKSSSQTRDKNVVTEKGEDRPSREVPQKLEAQLADALQYYAISSTEPQRKPRGRQLPSPTPFQQRKRPPELNDEASTSSQKEDFSRSHRPRAPPSPVPSLPRSNTASPALGAKPSMFRVKDNTNRGSSLTKSVKPRFHKNFGEDFRVGSPMELIDEEQQRTRCNAETPTNHKQESSTSLSSCPSQGHSAPLRHNRPYSRRSIAVDEDDSRSVISNMSEDVESYATSAADLADIRGLYDYERPESACSFSSDASRAIGKPPLVPPKSEKALRRAQRLTTRRIKKEMSSKGVTSTTASIVTPPSSSEVCSSNGQAVASPHCSAPVSLTHAPIPGSRLPSDHHSPRHTAPSTFTMRPTHDSSAKHHSAIDSHPVVLPHASGPIPLPLIPPPATSAVPIPVSSPHATDPGFFPVPSPHKIAPFSLPMTSPHANIPVSLPVTSPHANAPVSMPTAPLLVPSPYTKTPVHLPVSTPHMAAHISIPHGSSESGFIPQAISPKIVSHVPSSPTLHHHNYTAPVTQYHVESSYAHSYPLTQRRVMQDIGSGKYVQLNVRESGQGMSQHQPQHTYHQPPLQPMMQVNPQQPIHPPVTKGYTHYDGYNTRHQEYQPAGVPKRSPSGMSVPLSLPHEQQFINSDAYNSQAQQNGVEWDSPEQTPYMDTVNEKPKTLNTVYSPRSVHEPQESNTNGHESEPPVDARCQPRNIITMSELEDFMEISDW
ncbi:titin [Synchiropus splendidus]|uniref:titin n=1 Tax=Synchiropus splendidus TaxID=270530 RepID=UPI00237E8447|nr:titin [Synchiropus splendidus]